MSVNAFTRFFQHPLTSTRNFVCPPAPRGPRMISRVLGQNRLSGTSARMVTSGTGAAAGGAGTWFGLSWAERRFPKVMKKILGKRGSTRATVTKGVASAGGAFLGSNGAHKAVQFIRSLA